MLVSRLLMSHSCAIRFENQVLFVSGGASGIGLATAERVVADGGRAAIVDLDLERAEVAAAGLPGCIGLAANVADDAAVAGRRGAAGGIDLVLAAAGHAEFGPIAEWDSLVCPRLSTIAQIVSLERKGWRQIHPYSRKQGSATQARQGHARALPPEQIAQ